MSGLVPVEIYIDRTNYPDDYSGGLSLTGKAVGQYLAITPELSSSNGFSGNWVVTHRPTGTTLGGYGMCIGCAERVAVLAAEFDVDWAGGVEAFREMKDALKPLARKIGEIWNECDNDQVCHRRDEARLQAAVAWVDQAPS